MTKKMKEEEEEEESKKKMKKEREKNMSDLNLRTMTMMERMMTMTRSEKRAVLMPIMTPCGLVAEKTMIHEGKEGNRFTYFF